MNFINILALKKLRKIIVFRSQAIFKYNYFMCLVLKYYIWYISTSKALILAAELQKDVELKDIKTIRSEGAWYDNDDYQSRLDNIDRTIKRLRS